MDLAIVGHVCGQLCCVAPLRLRHERERQRVARARLDGRDPAPQDILALARCIGAHHLEFPHPEAALCECARLVQSRHPNSTQGFQMYPSTNEHVMCRCTCDPAHVGDWRGDHHRTRARDDQQDEGHVETLGRTLASHKPWGDHQKKSNGQNARGVQPGESLDGLLRVGAQRLGALDHLHELTHGRILALCCCLHLGVAAEVCGPGPHRGANFLGDGLGLARQGALVHEQSPRQHHAVRGDGVALPHHDGSAHGQIGGRHALAAGELRLLGAEGQDLRYDPARAQRDAGLEEIRRGEEDQNGGCLAEVFQRQGAKAGHQDEGVYVQVAACDSRGRTNQDLRGGEQQRQHRADPVHAP
mmetsp:Transcript_3320/g.9357  ORF Transcript_3320/g.9357 Transcript_3320/m.9357 type:complete len:357 (+) Transcript_3320:962-2032(+)